MKKLILLLLFIPLVSFGQNNNSTNSTTIKVESNNMFVDAANKKAEGEGIFYKGKGVYTIQQTGKTDIASYKRQVKKALEKIKSYSSGLKLNYEIINTERNDVPVGAGVARVIITFKLQNNDGKLNFMRYLFFKIHTARNRMLMMLLQRLFTHAVVTSY